LTQIHWYSHSSQLHGLLFGTILWVASSDVSCSPRPCPAPRCTSLYPFMSKLTMTDNAAQMLQWKQFVNTCCENQYEWVVPLPSPELTWSQVQHLARIPELKTCFLQQTMSLRITTVDWTNENTRDPQLSQVGRPPMLGE